MPKRSRRRLGWLRRLGKRLGLLFTVLLVMGCISEIALRVIGAKPKTASVLSAYFKPNQTLGWTGRPSAAYQFVTDDFDAFISHDEHGFRRSGLDGTIASDQDHAGEVVWCVGDSSTYGWGVKDGTTFVDLLNKKSEGQRIYRNLGVPGFSSLQEYMLLNDCLKRYRAPDLVLVLFCDNDVVDNLCPTMEGPYFEVVGGQPVLRGCPPQDANNWNRRSWLKENVLTYNYLSFYTTRAKHVLRRWFKGEAAVKQPTRREPERVSASQHESDRLLALRAAYQMIQQLCAEHDVEWAVATPKSDETLDRVCDELSIRLVNLSKYFERHAASSDKPVTFRWDPHWNELGNRIAANGLHEELNEIRLASDKTPSTIDKR